MESNVVLFVLRIALLIVLWVFVLLAIRSMARSVRGTGEVRSVSAPRRRLSGGQPPAAGLLVVAGPRQNTYCDLTTIDSVTLGRGSECTIDLGDDYSSKTHARVFRTPGGWFVEDLESRNGTLLQGRRITEPEALNVGDDIVIGQSTVRLVP